MQYLRIRQVERENHEDRSRKSSQGESELGRTLLSFRQSSGIVSVDFLRFELTDSLGLLNIVALSGPSTSLPMSLPTTTTRKLLLRRGRRLLFSPTLALFQRGNILSIRNPNAWQSSKLTGSRLLRQKRTARTISRHGSLEPVGLNYLKEKTQRYVFALSVAL